LQFSIVIYMMQLMDPAVGLEPSRLVAALGGAHTDHARAPRNPFHP